MTGRLSWLCVFLPPFLISSASVKSIPLLPYILLTFAWNVPLVSLIFLKISLVFPILLFSSISLCWSLRKVFYLSLLFFGTLHSDGYIFPFLLCLSVLFFSRLFVRPPQEPFCNFAFLFLEDCAMLCFAKSLQSFATLYFLFTIVNQL